MNMPLNKTPQDPLKPGKWFIGNQGKRTEGSGSRVTSESVPPEKEAGKWFVKEDNPESYQDNPNNPDKNKDYGEDSGLRFAARSAKSVASGIGGAIPDTLSAVYNLPALAFNYLKNKLKDEDPSVLASMGLGDFIGIGGSETDIPLIPSATEGIDTGIDALTNDYTATPDSEKIYHEALKMGSSVLGGGGLGKLASKGALSLGKSALAKGVEKTGNFTGSLKPSAIAGGVAMGAASEASRESGDSLSESMGKGALAAIATELTAKMLDPKRGLVKVMGFGKDKLKERALRAGDKIEVELRGAAATESAFTNQLQHNLSHLPFIGQKIDDSVHALKEQYIRSWDTFLDEIAPRLEGTETLSDVARSIYSESRALMPKTGEIDVSDWLKEIQKIEHLKPALVKADPTKKLFSILEEFKEAAVQKIKSNEHSVPLYDQYGSKLKDVANTYTKARKLTPQQLLDQKVELNKIMADKNLFDRLDSDALSLLEGLRKKTDDILEKWGTKEAPEWLEAFRKNQDTYANYAKREKLENLISKDIFNPATGESNYATLIKKLSDRKNKKLLLNSLGVQKYRELSDYTEVAKAISDIVRRNKNKSGSGHHVAAIGGVVGAIAGLTTAPLTTLASLGISEGVSRLMTSKKFINLARRLAKEPTQSTAKKLEATIEDTLGISVLELNRQLQEADTNTNDNNLFPFKT
jgi:hypothetical protein